MPRPSVVRVRRARVRQGVVALGLLLLGTSALTVVATDAPERVGPGGAPPSSSSLAGPPGPPPRVVETPEPPGRSGAPAPGLSPTARRWREAIIGNRRAEVLQHAQALRREPDGRAQLALLAADPTDRVRAYALRELGRLRDPALAPTFEAALSDPAGPVRENARWALDELGRR